MTQTFHFGSVSGAVIASALFFGFAILFGVAAATILRRLAAPAGEASYYGTTPAARRIIGAIVAIAVAIPIWIWLWGGFYRADVTATTITFHYLVPSRSTSIARADVVDVLWEPSARGSRVLMVVSGDGRRFVSAQSRYSREAERDVAAGFAAVAAR